MEKRALLVIDVQNVYFSGKMKITYPPGSLENILKAMDHAAKAGIPIVVVQHSSSAMASFTRGSEAWKLHPEVEKRPRDVLIEKAMPGSFTGTGLASWLRERGIGTITIAGYMVQMCCDTTSRQALELGFAVEFLSDATGTFPLSNAGGTVTAEEMHRAILVTQAMRFSRVMTAAEWIAAAGGREGT
ncbi:MAG: cysteine hydrolase family protein [Deltaproteobacteria bacterium]